MLFFKRCPAVSARQRAFTLVELLVVIGVIAILIAILLPAISRARKSAQRTACLSNLRSLSHAMVMYSDVNRGRLPNGNAPGVWKDYAGANLIMVKFNEGYVQSPRVFHCPSDTDPEPKSIVTADPTLPNSARTSYDFYFLYWAPEYGPILTQLKGQAPLAWDLDGGIPVGPHWNHNRGGNVVYADGHGAWQADNEWERTNWPSPADEFFP
jgi:prepilin-type N-terminal cleavage/methylation domain-containing protein/prepilin-type processing-associated H-X9-DG protein